MCTSPFVPDPFVVVQQEASGVEITPPPPPLCVFKEKLISPRALISRGRVKQRLNN